MTAEQRAQAESGYPTFSDYFLQLMHSTVVEEASPDDGTGGIRMSLTSAYGGGGVLGLYARDWGVKEWTPLLLARALADFKGRVGGEANVAAVGSDFIELRQTRCEFGEPLGGADGGNLCGVCRSAMVAVARASGLVDESHPAVGRCTIALGCRACDLTIALSDRTGQLHP